MRIVRRMRWFDSETPDLETPTDGLASIDPDIAGAVEPVVNRGTDLGLGVRDPSVIEQPPVLDLGPLQGCLQFDTTDLLVNGPDSVWTDSPRGLVRAVAPTGMTEEELRVLAARLVAEGGRHLDHASPCVDARLPGGIRVHAAIPPVSVGGTALSIRFPRRTGLALPDLQATGSVNELDAARLRALVSERANLLITGAAGSGKTTLLSALLSLAEPAERIVTIEDVAELKIDHPHVVALESRQANTEGVGEIPLSRLVRESLRMRPDRLVLGECRGAEVRDMLMALGSGHDGGASTLHARSLEEVGVRLETLGALAGLAAGTLARMVVCAIDAVIHVERRGGVRRVVAIGRPVRDGDEVRVEEFGRVAARS